MRGGRATAKGCSASSAFRTAFLTSNKADAPTTIPNRLEKLQGELAGYWSIRINDQWRITFKFRDNGAADEVTICDYHV